MITRGKYGDDVVTLDGEDVLRVYPIGCEVNIRVPGGKAMIGEISSIRIRPGNVLYEVVYWTNQERHETLLDAREVSPRGVVDPQLIGFVNGAT